MELERRQEALLPGYLASFYGLIGDRQTRVTFEEIVKGIINAGSLVCQRIAGASFGDRRERQTLRDRCGDIDDYAVPTGHQACE